MQRTSFGCRLSVIQGEASVLGLQIPLAMIQSKPGRADVSSLRYCAKRKARNVYGDRKARNFLNKIILMVRPPAERHRFYSGLDASLSPSAGAQIGYQKRISTPRAI